MKTILLPTDFSKTAFNAAHYAVNLANQLNTGKIILYNVYQTGMNVVADPMIPALGALDLESIKTASAEGLENFKNELIAATHTSLAVETLSEFTLITEGINNLCEIENVDLIVMGITGGGAIQENFFGSNTVSVAKHSKTPVIIVPPNAKFSQLNKILLVYDFIKPMELIPAALKKILDETKAKLYVLHVNTNQEKKVDIQVETARFDNLLNDYEKEYHFVTNPNFTEAVNQFAESIKSDLVVKVPQKHTLVDAIFKKSHTNMLAFHTRTPLMVTHN
jgi:Universal stress protein UspA and related nucleotide-binding proteins